MTGNLDTHRTQNHLKKLLWKMCVRSFVRQRSRRHGKLICRAERQAEMFDERTKRFVKLKCLTNARNVLPSWNVWRTHETFRRAEMFDDRAEKRFDESSWNVWTSSLEFRRRRTRTRTHAQKPNSLPTLPPSKRTTKTPLSLSTHSWTVVHNLW